MNQLANSYSYPVLEDDKFDYKEDIVFKIKQIETDSKENYIVFEYQLLGDSLISQLLKNNEAKFITTIVLKSAMYRETIDTILEEISPTYIKQKIPLQTTFETQNFFSAIVYTGEDKKIVLNSKSMGLDDFWDGIEVELKKGAILAKGGWRELENSASDLLTVKKDESVKYGFEVTVIATEGGRFLATVEPNLYDKIKLLPKNNDHLRSIVIHMLCLGFIDLKERFKEDDSELTNFKGIKLELKSKNISTWEDDDFKPNQVACYFLRHMIKTEQDDE
jgi:hypothetical protein